MTGANIAAFALGLLIGAGLMLMIPATFSLAQAIESAGCGSTARVTCLETEGNSYAHD